MKSEQCPNTSCGLATAMCLDHDPITGADVPYNAALAPIPARPSMALRIAAWRTANRREHGRAS